MGCCGSKNETVHPEVLDPNQQQIIFKKNKVFPQKLPYEFDVSEWKHLIQTLNSNKDIQRYALSLKRNQFRSIQQLIHFLRNFNCRNDFEKAWLIYLWITHNIDYNIRGYQTGNYGDNDTNSVLQNGYSVCEGYANLFEDLCKGLNLRCKKISGYSKGFGYEPGDKMSEPNHAWNAVNIENKWYYVESTWGAGSCTNDYRFERKFNPYWFMTPAQIFIYTHYSENFQYKKMSLTQFEEMPFFDLDFHLFDIECLSHNSSIINSTYRDLFIEFSVPKEVLLIASLKDKNTEKEIENSVVIQRDSRTNNYGVIVLLPEKNKLYKVNIYGKYESNPSKTYTSLTYFLVTKIKDEPNNTIPRYSIVFKPNLRCLSHYSQLIRIKTNPVQLNFVALKPISITGDIRIEQNEPIKNCVLVQKIKNKNEYEIKAILPKKNILYDLNLFVKQDTDSYDLVGKMKVIREEDIPSIDNNKFYKNFSNENLEYYVYNPVNLQLKRNENYEFKFFIKNVEKVALVDQNSNWLFLNLESDSIWILNQSFDTPGDLTVFYKKTSNDNKFDALCSYTIV